MTRMISGEITGTLGEELKYYHHWSLLNRPFFIHLHLEGNFPVYFLPPSHLQ